MRFRVIENSESVPRQGRKLSFLWTDNWDDWFEYSTQYLLSYFDGKGNRHQLGQVKIGQFKMASGQRRPDLPEEFESLDERFFSLGQDATYYENIRKLGSDDRALLLRDLNDVVADEELYIRARNERVMGMSLMRHVNERTLVGQFRRILAGGARLTDYTFHYRGPNQMDEAYEPIELSFAVEPFSKPPTNIQVLIGRNGVGKSFLLNAMSRALVNPEESETSNGIFVDTSSIGGEFASPFANVVSVTFSAFDDFPVIQPQRNVLNSVQYTNIGLRKFSRATSVESDVAENVAMQEPNDLVEGFVSSAMVCAGRDRKELWMKALGTLESDPIFEEATVSDLLLCEYEEFGRQAERLFRRLSSGHKIVLLTVTKLVERVEERTLVLMDEPEAHLHPPLLSAFVRALSNLLVHRNGVAIVATHSPVVLQEVPKSCVWKLRRHGGCAVAERVRAETFGENVGHLTHEVFGLEVTRSGFYKMIGEAIEKDDDFDSVNLKFGGEIGLEGRALISMLLAQDGTIGSKGDE